MGKTFQDLLNNGQAQVLGIVSPVPMGNWLSTTQYQKLNLVRHNTATYIARTSNQNIEPGVADNWATYWMLICIDGGQVSPDGEYPEMSVGSVMHALLWGNKSYDGSSTQTITAADLGLADVYKPQGSVTFANLPATPNESNYGYVWNISDDFTTDSRFLEGAGKACPAGTNVGVIEQDGVYYYDILGAFMDLSNYAEIDGSYPTLGAGHLSRSIFVGNQNNNGWHKFATWTPSGTAAQLVSTIFLVNGVNASTIENSGHIQLDSYIGANAATAEIQNFNAMDGNINLSAFCAVVNGKNIDLYTNLQPYRSYNITIIDECDSNGNQVNEIQLSNTFYGTSAPSGAVYATVRNKASEDEDGNNIVASYAKQNGSYPTLGAGYLQHQGISSVSSSTIGWYKVGTTSASKIVSGNGSVSVIFLVNGVYQIENTATPTRSGLLELDVTKLNGNFTAFTISVLGGALDPEQFFGVLENNVVTLYWRNVSTYGKVDFTILTQQDETLGNWSDLFEFDIAFYGATAPSGAVYAVNRNVAAKVENALTIIKDGVSTVYDGSEAKTVEITENGGITVIEIPANDSGTLTSEQLQQVKNNPQNTVLRRTVSPERNEIYCFDAVSMSQGADSAYTFRNVTSMAQDSLTLQAISVNLGSGLWTYSSVQTSAGGGGSGIAIVTIPQDGVSTNPAMSGTIELASPENTVIKIYNGEDNDGARYTYSILTSFDENASGDVPEYVYSGEDYIVTCTKSNGNTYNYTLTETSGGGGTQLYRHTITNVTSNVSDIIYIVSPEAAQYTGIGLLFTAVCYYGGQYQNARGDTVGTIVASQYGGQYNFAVFNGSSFLAISVSDSKTYNDTVTPL